MILSIYIAHWRFIFLLFLLPNEKKVNYAIYIFNENKWCRVSHRVVLSLCFPLDILLKKKEANSTKLKICLRGSN